MAQSSTTVKVGDSSFDPTAIVGWIENHVWVFLLCAAIAFVFFIFQKGGFAEKYLAYRTRKDELDAKKLDDLRAVTDIFVRKYDRPDPLLPFDDMKDRRQ